jgi:hypothetical protein
MNFIGKPFVSIGGGGGSTDDTLKGGSYVRLDGEYVDFNALVKDAMRYRWLRDNNKYEGFERIGVFMQVDADSGQFMYYRYRGEAADKLIDKAMEAPCQG